jgi:hypothetical protein
VNQLHVTKAGFAIACLAGVSFALEKCIEGRLDEDAMIMWNWFWGTPVRHHLSFRAVTPFGFESRCVHPDFPF